jgi:sensor histidine kinase YesM
MVQSGEDGHGLGLANTRARLEKLHGEQGSVTVSTPLNNRFLVSIQFPLTKETSIASVVGAAT